MGLYDGFDYLKVEVVEDGIGLITINRPEIGNAYDLAGHTELVKIWDAVDHDPAIRVVVITGAGDAFCHPGGHISNVITKWFAMPKAEFFAQNVRGLREGPGLVYNVINCEKPIVAAVNGATSGGGLAIATMADISVVAETATFHEVHIPIGIAAGDHIALWAMHCGLAKAKLYALTGGVLDGKEAERIGLVSRCVPKDQVVPVAMEYARQLANGPQYAIRFTKRALNQWLRLGGIVSFDISHTLEHLNFFDVDTVAAYENIVQGKEPVFPSVKTAGPKHT